MRIRSWKHHPDFPVGENASFRGFWEFELQSGEQTIPHQHEDGDEIAVALEGCGQITVGDVSREMKSGEVVYIPARTSHFIENPASPILRGFTLETGVSVVEPEVQTSAEPTSAHDLEKVISDIPAQLDESEALQLIIRLFDLAGHLSEQIEHALGLDGETGYNALTEIQRRVMEAVVRISSNYQGGPGSQGGPGASFDPSARF